MSALRRRLLSRYSYSSSDAAAAAYKLVHTQGTHDTRARGESTFELEPAPPSELTNFPATAAVGAGAGAGGSGTPHERSLAAPSPQKKTGTGKARSRQPPLTPAPAATSLRERIGRGGQSVGGFFAQRLSNNAQRRKTLVHASSLALLLFALFGWPLLVFAVGPAAKSGTACDRRLIAVLTPMAVAWFLLGMFGLALIAYTRLLRRPLESTGAVGWVGGALFVVFFTLWLVLQFQLFRTRQTPFVGCGADKHPCCSWVIWGTSIIMVVASYVAALLLCTWPSISRMQERRQQARASMRGKVYARLRRGEVRRAREAASIADAPAMVEPETGVDASAGKAPT